MWRNCDSCSTVESNEERMSNLSFGSRQPPRNESIVGRKLFTHIVLLILSNNNSIHSETRFVAPDKSDKHWVYRRRLRCRSSAIASSRCGGFWVSRMVGALCS